MWTRTKENRKMPSINTHTHDSAVHRSGEESIVCGHILSAPATARVTLDVLAILVWRDDWWSIELDESIWIWPNEPNIQWTVSDVLLAARNQRLSDLFGSDDDRRDPEWWLEHYGKCVYHSFNGAFEAICWWRHPLYGTHIPSIVTSLRSKWASKFKSARSSWYTATHRRTNCALEHLNSWRERGAQRFSKNEKNAKVSCVSVNWFWKCPSSSSHWRSADGGGYDQLKPHIIHTLNVSSEILLNPNPNTIAAAYICIWNEGKHIKISKQATLIRIGRVYCCHALSRERMPNTAWIQVARPRTI